MNNDKAEAELKAAAVLRRAAAHIETALVLLDMAERRCGSCGTRHWNNSVHAKIYQQFTNSPHALRTAADRLDLNRQVALSAKKEQ